MTKKMASDEKIKQLALETDKFLSEKVMEFQEDMHPLEASAIFLSRIILMNRSIGLEKEFRRLGTTALNIQEPEPLIKEEQDAN